MLKSFQLPTSPLSSYQDTYAWLMSQRIISCPIDDVPQKSVDGTFLCILIHKLEGRTCSLGFHKSPKTFSACRANIKKALEYLRQFSKFRSQFLWNYEEILQGQISTVWGLFNDIRLYYAGASIKNKDLNIVRPSSVPPKSKIYNKSSPDARPILTQLETSNVKAWIEELGLSYLIQPNLHYLKDPVRNGVLLAKVLNQVKSKFEFFSHPQNVEQVEENILSVVFQVKNEIKGYNTQELMDEKHVWALLGKIMNTYKHKDPVLLPYSLAEVKNLQHSVFKWVFSLKPFDQFYPENFFMLCKSLKTGVVLIKILEKLLKKPIEYIKYPNLPEECLHNLELVFKILKSQGNMSKGFLWDPLQVFKSNQIYILGLLEDLHRFSSALPPRPMGENYHSDGPYYGKQMNFSISYQEEKSVWATNSIYLSPEKSFQVQSMLNSRSGSPFKTSSNFRNSCEVTLDNISPKARKIRKINMNGFEWIQKIGIKVPRNMDLNDEKIPAFRSGEVLCEILQVLETRSFRGVMKTYKGTAAAAKNVSIAFEVLRKKPAFGIGFCFVEEKVLAGHGEHIRALLKEIYRIYQSSIISLTKFN